MDETSVDYFQLVVTLMERTGHLDLTGPPTTAKCRAAAKNLQNAEVAMFMAELLQPQAAQISSDSQSG